VDRTSEPKPRRTAEIHLMRPFQENPANRLKRAPVAQWIEQRFQYQPLVINTGIEAECFINPTEPP
jgi:hypothetical protein